MTALVKGPKSFISDGEIVAVMGEGTPALAKAGTGDVLAGMLGALLAQGLASFDACVLAATLHARAGRLAASELTERCVVAEDLPRSEAAWASANRGHVIRHTGKNYSPRSACAVE